MGGIMDTATTLLQQASQIQLIEFLNMYSEVMPPYCKMRQLIIVSEQWLQLIWVRYWLPYMNLH